ncbi:MAG: NAAT family transporter [Myxococcales bacterium]|nr:NAAT family transporter [Myxococcales bacterium]
MEIALIRNFLLAMIAIVNPLGKIPVWIEASEGCDGPVRFRLALLVTGTATLLLVAFLFFGQAILDFLGLDIPSFRVGGGIIILLIGIDMLRGQAVDVDTSAQAKGDDALDRAKARFRDIVVPVAVPILAGPGSITTVLLFGIRAEDWRQRLMLGGLLLGVMIVVLILLLLGRPIQRVLGSLALSVQTRIWGLLLTAIAAQLILVGLGESFPAWLESTSPLMDDLVDPARVP